MLLECWQNAIRLLEEYDGGVREYNKECARSMMGLSECMKVLVEYYESVGKIL